MVIRDKSFWSLRPNTQDEFIVDEVYYGNCYRLPEDMTGITVIDIGANIGAFTVACLDRGARVVAYEPDIDCFNLLLRHTSLCESAKYMILNDAVIGDESKCRPSIDLFYPNKVSGTELTGGKSIYSKSDSTINVECIRASTAIGQFVGTLWLKLDCEGAEYEIILSSLPWDRISRIFGECHDLIDGRLSKDTGEVSIDLGDIPINRNTIVSRLESVGYKVELVPNPDDEHLSLFWAERIITSKPKQVVVLTPFRNARGSLPLYFAQLSALRDSLSLKDYSLRLVAAEGDSLDGTRERIEALSTSHEIALTVADTTHGGMRWGSVEDPVRLRTMSDVMNKALGEVTDSDDIVVWIMSDTKWQVDDLLKMIDYADRREWNYDVFAPMVFIDGIKDDKGHELFYDTWAYRLNGRFTAKYPYHGLFAYGVMHLSEVDSAGTCLVMRGEIARKCRASNEEAVSFCADAKSKDYRIAVGYDWKFYHSVAVAKKRLLFIGDALCNTGFARVTHALLPSLAEAGYELDIVAINYDGIPHNYPYRFWPAAVRGQAGTLGEYRIQQLIMTYRFDLIVLLNDPWNVDSLMNVLSQCEENGAEYIPPVVAYLTVDSVNQKGKELNGLDEIVCCTEFGRTELIRSGCTVPISVIPFGVDTSKFKLMDRSECRKWATDGHIGDGAFIIGYVGTAQYRKRLDLLLKCFAVWVGRYPDRDSYLYLSISNQNRTSTDIDSLVAYYRLQGKVLSPSVGGRLDDESLAKVYNSFDVLVSCALGEGFGLTILEAMACGTPTVFANNSGLSSWIDDDYPGRVACSSTALLGPMNYKPYTIGSVVDIEDLLRVLDWMYQRREIRSNSASNYGLSIAASLPWSLMADRFVGVVDRVVESSRAVEVEKELEVEIYQP